MSKSKRNTQLSCILTIVCWASALFAAAPDIVLADFEGTNYGAWTVTGTAFGSGPARGTLANQQSVSGYAGQGLVNTYFKGDDSTGSLTSPEFRVERRYLNFLIGGGNRPGEAGINLIIDGKVTRSATGGDDEKLDWTTWDLDDVRGKMARIEIFDRATGGWGHVNVDQIVHSDSAKTGVQAPFLISTERLYDETFRPQFHFTARSNWLNDPNGLVYYKDEYHLFFQHNPTSVKWGSMTWGHAVSPDMIHWTQMEHALWPDKLGTMFSGSAVIDWKNTGGFQTGAEPPLVCIYTAAGGTSEASKGQPFTQCIAYSNDRGRTFTKWKGNPVLKNVAGDNRDPKVFWHEPTARWVMALYVPVRETPAGAPAGKPATIETIQLFASSNLKDWSYLSRLDGFFECPDMFELPVDGDRKNTRWVVFGANGEYTIGRFDGTTFTKESGKLKSDFGKNFYAAQTYSDMKDGRRILIGWMNGGKYPGMPFNQQMTVPCELTLRNTADGIRMFKWPVKELEALRGSEQAAALTRSGDGNIQCQILGAELLDLNAEFEVRPGAEVHLQLRGHDFTWIKPSAKFTALDRSMPLGPMSGTLKLRILMDRTSVEVFGNDGIATMSSCFLPKGSTDLKLEGQGVTITELHPFALKSAWPRSQ